MDDYDRIVAPQAEAKELQETIREQREDPSKAKEYATTTERQLEDLNKDANAHKQQTYSLRLATANLKGSRSDAIATKAIAIKIPGSSSDDATPPGNTTPPDLSTDESESEEESLICASSALTSLPRGRISAPTPSSCLGSARQIAILLPTNLSWTASSQPRRLSTTATSTSPATTIHRLDPFFKGAKPPADMESYECIPHRWRQRQWPSRYGIRLGHYPAVARQALSSWPRAWEMVAGPEDARSPGLEQVAAARHNRSR
jgi:hypothetical protein